MSKSTNNKKASSELTPADGHDGAALESYAQNQKAGLEDSATQQKQNIKYERLFHDNADAIFVANAKTMMLVDCNHRAEQLMQMTRDEILNLSPLDLHPKELVEQTMQDFQNQKEGQSIISKTAVLRKDGQVIPVEISAVTYEVDGEMYQIGMFRDVSESRGAEKALKAEREKFRRVFESSNDALMLLDSEKFFDANQATIDLFGCKTRDEFLGKHPGEVSPPVQPDGTPSKDAANERIGKALKEGKNFFRWTHRRADGTDFPATVLLTPLELDGKLVLQATVRDITEELANQQKLEALDRLKSRFITTLTHVTRTPLNRIRWSLESLESGEFGDVTEEERVFIRQALESEDEVLHVINNMNLALDVERGTLSLNKMPTSLISLLRSIVVAYKHHPTNEDVVWQEEIPVDKISAVNVDVEKLRIAVNAIVDNAMRYSTGDNKEVSVKIVESGNCVRCEIADKGIGVPDSEQSYVFDRFFRASNAQLAHPNGMGLGIHIAKSIVDSHEGRIGFDSSEGEGTRFWFELPASKLME